MRNNLLSFNQNKQPKVPEFAHSGRKPAAQVLNAPDVHFRSAALPHETSFMGMGTPSARPSFQAALNSETFDAEVVDVLFSFDGKDQYARPVRVTWQGEEYWLGGVQFWYAEHRQGVLVHHYRVSDESGEYTFELSLETENLTWSLDRVAQPTARTQSSHIPAGAAV